MINPQGSPMMKKYLPAIALLFVAMGFGRAGGQTLQLLHTFGSSPTDGMQPRAGMVQGTNGDFYSTTYAGGTNHSGMVFAINSQGTLTNLWSFSGIDGKNPSAALVQGTNGNFYGTTVNGGTNNLGTVFMLSPQGTFSNLWQFNGTNGSDPAAGLVLGRDGNFYGTTLNGGTNNNGTVFQITPQGMLTNLWQFTTNAPTNGVVPLTGLVQGTDGNFYGTTSEGGTNGAGTVFQITPQGMLTTLWQFATNAPTNGLVPFSALVQGNDGNFYGTTDGGGTNHDGTIFRITTNGVLTSLWSFTDTDGKSPVGLTLGSDGNFYGTTGSGGTNENGTIFRFTPEGILTTLWQFGSDTNNGTQPIGTLVQGSDGNFYGTASKGGTNNNGTVFELIVSPKLAITPSGPDVILTWPTNAAGFTLESATNLVPPVVWVTNATTPVVVSTNNVVTNTITGTKRFYRLIQ